MGGWQWGLQSRERERGNSEKSLVKSNYLFKKKILEENNYLFNLVFNKYKIA